MRKENSYSFLAGDFNINLLKLKDNDGFNNFFEYLCEKGFIPLITLPTRFDEKSCSLLDHIWVSKPVKGALVPNTASSRVLLKKIAKADHIPGIASINILDKKVLKPKFVYSQRIDDESITNFKNDLATSGLLESINQSIEADPEETYNKIDETIKTLKDKNFPTKKVKFKRHIHNVQPWMTDILLLNIKIKDQTYIKFRKAKSAIEKSRLKKQLKNLEKDISTWIQEAKAKYYSEQLNEHKSDLKKTWDTIKMAINRRNHKSPYPDYFTVNGKNIFDKTDIANGFNKYFTSIGPDLAASLDTHGKPGYASYLGPKPTSRFRFHSINTETISKLINNLPSKPSAGPDGISSIILKSVTNEISPILTVAINQSLHNGLFPSKLKIAKVIPLFKNKGEETDFGNYRPISLLNVISKIFERVVYNQLYEYFTVNNLFYSSQYGFRKRHSTEDAAMELVDKINSFFENDANDQVLAVFLDLSKAFDTMDHEILLTKLAHYGIEGSVLRWFRCFLSDRKQFIHYDDVDSDPLTISVGTAQGSILGPLLFLIYVNDAYRSSNALDFIHFADDTSLINSFSCFRTGINATLNHSQIERRVNAELQRVYDWLCINKLSLNVSKTRSVIFKSSRIATVSRPFNIEINNEAVTCLTEFNFLGNRTWRKYAPNFLAL